jgi:hypothetical protein
MLRSDQSRRNRHLTIKFRGSHAARRLFLAACSAHIVIIAADADMRRWGALRLVISREE